ncbi:hypothetical protein [Acholeplasma hippikon]|uniref:V-type ATP synthase subunit C n=1 Tax=Acholeplasma hippikon TaxID=264636 RepID=A0A449BHX4_9MOLU|nr:hypothetical protein [Acholeplasma hippikon]VEU82013.1 Uncharacterised protein [Acholeplasma hippikon]
MNLSFTNGVISAGFDRLLTDSHFAAFSNLSQSDFLDMLKTHQYGLTFSKNFEQTMLEEEYKHKLFLESLIDKKHIIFEVLYIKFNHLFLASLLKSFHLGVKYTPMMHGLTTYHETAFIDYIIYDNAKALDFDDKVFLDDLIKETSNLDAQGISDKIIQILHSNLLKKLNTKKIDASIKNYYETYTMIENVLYFIRAKKYKFSYEKVEENILKNSLIDKSIILSYYDLDLSQFGEYLKLHFNDEIVNVFKDTEAFDFLSKVYAKLDLAMSKLLGNFAFDNQTFGLMIYFTIKKREEIIRLKQMYYGVEV